MERTVTVTHVVKVTVDETKFTEEWMAEFRRHFYPFDTLDEHIEHLGELFSRGLINEFGDPFIEGYGNASEMGIRFEWDYTEVEVEPERNPE